MARRTAGLTQVQLAAAAGCSRETLSRAENGRAPSVRVALALARVLHADVADLFAGLEVVDR